MVMSLNACVSTSSVRKTLPIRSRRITGSVMAARHGSSARFNPNAFGGLRQGQPGEDDAIALLEAAAHLDRVGGYPAQLDGHPHRSPTVRTQAEQIHGPVGHGFRRPPEIKHVFEVVHHHGALD